MSKFLHNLNKCTLPRHLTLVFFILSIFLTPYILFPFNLILSYMLALLIRFGIVLPFIVTPKFRDPTLQPTCSTKAKRGKSNTASKNNGSTDIDIDIEKNEQLSEQIVIGESQDDDDNDNDHAFGHHYYAIVTGAAYGIGYGYCKRFARENYNLVMIGRNRERLESAANEIRTHHSNRIKIIVIARDLSIRAPTTASSTLAPTDNSHTHTQKSPLIAQSIHDEILQNDAKALVVHLVNNAGFGSHGHYVQADVYNELNMVDLNICCLMDLSHYFANQMSQWYEQFLSSNSENGEKQEIQGEKTKFPYLRPRITNISSISAYQAMPHMITYAASKHFIQSFSLGLSHELKTRKIDVITVCPGAVATEFGNRAKMTESDRAREEGGWLERMVVYTVDQLVDETFPQMIGGEMLVLNGALNHVVTTVNQLMNCLCLPLAIRMTADLIEKQKKKSSSN